jgi:lysozyme family protein
MAEFEPAFNFMIPHEGGYVNDPDDPGSETNFGISKRSYPDLDIAALTLEDAAAIYQRDFWDNQYYSEIKSQPVANKVFDLAVNMGTNRAHVLAQRSCGDCGHPVKEDGHIGPFTVLAINQSDEELMLHSLRFHAAKFYRDLATTSSSRMKFLAGWLRRAAV